MNNLIFSLNTTMPIFLVMVIGYILKQIGMLNDNFVTVANKFNFKVTLPFMLFRDISTVNIREIFHLKYVLFCALASTACFWVIWGATKLFVKDKSSVVHLCKAPSGAVPQSWDLPLLKIFMAVLPWDH